MAGLVANPYFIGFYTTDGSIVSKTYNFTIIAFELFIICCGILVIWKKPKSSANIALSLTVFFLCLFLSEFISVSTNIFAPHGYKQRHNKFYGFFQPDSDLGVRPRSNLRYFNDSWMEGDVSCLYSTDNYGFRNIDRDYSSAKIFFIGDSFVFGVWMPRNKAFYGIIESDLKEPVITLGVPAYGFKQYKTLMSNFVQHFNPDTIVLGVFANDLYKLPSESYIKDFYNKAGWNKFRSVSPTYKDRSFIAQIINIFKRQNLGKGKHKEMTNGIFLYKIRGTSPNYIAASEYVEVEAAFLDIVDLAKKSNIRLVVILIPSKESTYKSEYLKLFQSNYLDNEEEGYARISKIADEQGIVCVNLTPIFRAHANNNEKLYFDKDPHWNELGHKLAADVLYPYLVN